MIGLIEIFFSPGKVFDRVREKSMFVPGLLGVMLLTALSVAVVTNLVGMKTLARIQIENSPRMMAQLTPEQRSAAIQGADTPLRKGLAYGFAILGSGLGMLAVSGLALGGLTLMGAKLRYPQALGATSYGVFPFSVLTLFMTSVILLVTPDRESLNLQNLVATNIGAYLDKETTGKALLSIANSIDLISLGEILFVGWGYSKVAGLPFGKGVFVTFSLWLIYVIGKAGFAAI